MMQDVKNLKLAISCGGTGGHFYPGLSVARCLNSEGGKAILLLSGTNAEKQKKIAESFGVVAIALPLMVHPKRPRLFFKFFDGFYGGYKLSLKMLKKYQIEAILGMGSFASLPPIFAAKKLRIPLYLHDGNAKIGKANRYLSRIATQLWSAFDMVNQNKVKCKSSCIGMPLRPEITHLEKITKEQAIKKLNDEFNVALKPELITILIFGGSQGAEIFNVTLPKALKSIAKNFPIQVLHLTGKDKLEYTNDLYDGVDFPFLLLESSEKMELFYQASDIVFSRSGGSSVAEIAFFGKASILVPYPYAAENHQLNNAEYLSKNNGTIVLENKLCTEDLIIEKLEKLLADKSQIELMSQHAAEMKKLDVAEKILELICQPK